MKILSVFALACLFSANVFADGDEMRCLSEQEALTDAGWTCGATMDDDGNEDGTVTCSMDGEDDVVLTACEEADEDSDTDTE